ncbi:hypothetical protein [Dyella acidiphila]|uniref:Uncharacterized protein n=1 Tax=Dyella acidiphila TaxID=2775866 RepID=A0ABR9GAJ2_9GAMM|nr:hypothetical protein [Dyella acidiphila]MBE1161031.1 hypothetical protein [Dyella acidiphila]
MDYPYDDAVSAALLDFSALPEKKRDAFIDSFNKYDDRAFAVLSRFNALDQAQREAFRKSFNAFIYVSPQRQKGIADELMRRCRDSADPCVRQVAESAAAYMAQNKKKGRPRKQ